MIKINTNDAAWSPCHLITWSPKRMDKIASKMFKRWIAADTLFDKGAAIIQNQTS